MRAFKSSRDGSSEGKQRLKPERWKSAFDKDGKVVGFAKVLKIVRSGGVDSSIRCEVWEFLLGAYAVGSTRDHREEIRQARRKRYEELIDQCRAMHASIGTGKLAYNVGSKIMDARTSAATGIKDDSTRCPDQNIEDSSSTALPSPRFVPYSSNSAIDSSSSRSAWSCYKSSSTNRSYSPGRIGPNSPNVLHFKFFHPSPAMDQSGRPRIWTNRDKLENFGRVKKAMDSKRGAPPSSPGPAAGIRTDDRTAGWLWTLHRIVIDVVRTDRHLEFYNDPRNMARLSDILAVFAWIDATVKLVKVFLAGMSDLLSPFVILFENDADAFWCFESLLKRMRQNFQPEGPSGVMRQLEALPKILELADERIFRHLTGIGVDSFVFAFRMLLLHFRRELAFEETLCMWEMMWAADFDQAILWSFESEPLEALQLKLPSRSLLEKIQEDDYMDYHWNRKRSPCTSPLPEFLDPFSHSSGISSSSSSSKITFESKSPLCGLMSTSWPNFGRHRIRSGMSFGRNGDSEIPVFVVVAIVVINREKLLREAKSIDDVIKMFNEIQLKIQVRSCVRAAMKMRTKYHQELAKRATAKSTTTKNKKKKREKKNKNLFDVARRIDKTKNIYKS